MRIQNNIMAMNTHRMYTINNSNIQKSAEKLSSGYRINRAGDDAAGLAISEKMRSQIRGLGMASKNSQDAISLVQTAEGALQEVHSMLQRMNELAVQAATGTNQTFDRLQLAKEFDQLKREINDIAEQTTFNNMKILDGSLSSEGPERSAQTAGLLMTNSVPSYEEGVTSSTAAPKNDAVDSSSISVTPKGLQDIPATAATLTIDLNGIKEGDVGTDKLESIDVAGVTMTITGGVDIAQDQTLVDAIGTRTLELEDGDGKKFTAKMDGDNLVITAHADNLGVLDQKDSFDVADTTVKFNFETGTNMSSDTGTAVIADGTDKLEDQDLEASTTFTVGKDFVVGDKLTFTSTIDGATASYTFEVTADNLDDANDDLATLLNGDAGFKAIVGDSADAVSGAGGEYTIEDDTVFTNDGDKITVSYTGAKIVEEEDPDADPVEGATANADVNSYLEIDRNKMRLGDEVTVTIDGEAHTATWDGDVQSFVDQLAIDGAELKTNTLVIKGQELTQENVDFTPADIENIPYGTMRIQVGALEFEQLNIEVKSMNTKGLNLDDHSLTDQDTAGAAITATRTAVNIVSEQRALLGAMQNRLEHKISNLDNTAENLQAAESRIRDVDIAKEMTTFTKNNILAQAATAMLAQANAAPQSVLSLLQ